MKVKKEKKKKVRWDEKGLSDAKLKLAKCRRKVEVKFLRARKKGRKEEEEEKGKKRGKWE